MISKAQIMATTAGDTWLAKGANLLLFGPPGGGKSHLAAAIHIWRAVPITTASRNGALIGSEFP